ncbi:MAG: DASS family sodium-coupled anion symporter [Vicinamibacterales bacterium]|nr:DASS family sodium-coupled anion symporter [Vicinamibacterales bacterium]
MTSTAGGKDDRQAVWMLLGATVLMLVVHLLPTPAPLERNGELIALTADGKTCLAILLFAVTLWVSEAMPFPATSLLVLVLIPAFGITDFASTVNAGFGSPLIVFFIGVLFLSTGFTRSGLGTRMVLHVLRLAGTRTDRVLLGFLTVGALLSMWITDMAVAAVMLPLGVGVLKDAGLKPLESNFGRALMISCAYGPLIGGIGTPAGTAANLIAISYLEEIAGLSISFGQWMLLGVPAAVLMVPVGWRLLLWLFPPEIDALAYERAEIDAQLAGLGPLAPVERKTVTIFGLTILAWLITPWLAELTGGRVDPPIQAVALLGGVTLFLPGIRVLTWKEAHEGMDWGGVMLIVAGLSLGLMVFETGAARWLAQVLLGNLILVPSLLRPFVIVIAVALLHLLFSSNTVTGSLIMPILLALALDLGLDAWTIAAPAAFTSTLAFILVTESPTNVLPYSAGYFSIRDMAKVGIWMTLGAAVCVTVSVTVVGLFTG